MARALGDLVFIWMQPEYNQLSHVCYCKETHRSQSVCIYWSDGRLDCLEAGCLPPVTRRLRELHTQTLAISWSLQLFATGCWNRKISVQSLMPFLLLSYWNYGNINKNKTAWGQQPRKTDHLQISGERRTLKDFWLFLVVRKVSEHFSHLFGISIFINTFWGSVDTRLSLFANTKQIPQ